MMDGGSFGRDVGQALLTAAVVIVVLTISLTLLVSWLVGGCQ